MEMLGGGFFPEEHYCTLNNLGCLKFFLEIRPSGITTSIYGNTPVVHVQLVFGQSHRQDFMAVT